MHNHKYQLGTRKVWRIDSRKELMNHWSRLSPTSTHISVPTVTHNTNQVKNKKPTHMEHMVESCEAAKMEQLE